MDALVLLARLALAGVFVVSSIGKLLDLEGSERATRNFGVPEPFAKPAGVALPLFELLIAILLLPVATAAFGGLLALLLLIAFVVGVGYNMSRGNQFDCHCFGQIHSEPIGWKTLARNAGLAAVALLITVGGLAGHPGASLVAWTQAMSGFGWVVLALMLVNFAALSGVVWLLVHLLGQNGRLLVRIDRIEEALADADIEIPEDDDEEDEDDEDEEEEGLPFGTPAPAFSLTGIHGETMTLDALRAQNKPVLLVFSDPNCGPCNGLMPDIAKWQRDSAAKLTVAIVSRGDRDANKRKAEEHNLSNVLLQQDSEVSDQYQTYGTPTAILVRPDGTIGSGAALGSDQIRTLYKQALENKVPVPA
ncbi:MAG TPA: MauE/DoxX family redox-associated membrane protein, partial [Thermomicrobiales bacterium]|nr:MauE/DoxX family redox-associated membrane protein [Thermomicrobiales bacterium]